MSPENARVFIAEDNKNFLDIIQEYLEEAGHSVVLKANTLTDALAGVDNLEKLGIDVAVLDGNLDEWETKGYDGQEVLRAIRATAPRVRTIGMSGNKFPNADIDLGKDKVENIGDVVTKL